MDFKPISGTKVIGLGHSARQGKDTVANFMIDIMGSSVVRIGFADALYAVARVEHGMTTKDPALLQRLGTEVFRAKDPNTWIRTLYYTALDRKPEVLVIPDVRFPNEADFVHEMGGHLVKIVRYNLDGTKFQDPSRNPDHPSEASLNDYAGWDFELHAETSDMLKLKNGAEFILEELDIV